MSSGDNFLGLAAFGALALLVPYILNIVLAPTQGPAVATVIALATGLVIVAVGAFGARSQGMAFFGKFGEWMQSIGDDTPKKALRSANGAKVPRPPTYWTNRLIEAVGGVCEIQRCTKVQHLQVNHIQQHAKGGGNALTNLIVVCPNHHKDCDRGAINATRQKAIISRTNRFKDTDFPGKWKKSVLAKQHAKQEEDALAW